MQPRGVAGLRRGNDHAFRYDNPIASCDPRGLGGVAEPKAAWRLTDSRSSIITRAGYQEKRPDSMEENLSD